MKMTEWLCKTVNPKESETRTVRCVTGAENNKYGQCFAMTWRFIYALYTGNENIEQYSTQFTYDFINGKREK